MYNSEKSKNPTKLKIDFRIDINSLMKEGSVAVTKGTREVFHKSRNIKKVPHGPKTNTQGSYLQSFKQRKFSPSQKSSFSTGIKPFTSSPSERTQKFLSNVPSSNSLKTSIPKEKKKFFEPNGITSNIGRSTLKLDQVYKTNSPYSELFTWSRLFALRHIKEKLDKTRRKEVNTFRNKTQNNSKRDLVISEDIIKGRAHSKKKQKEDFGDYLIAKKNEMLKEIFDKKNVEIDLSSAKQNKTVKYVELPMEKRIEFLLSSSSLSNN